MTHGVHVFPLSRAELLDCVRLLVLVKCDMLDLVVGSIVLVLLCSIVFVLLCSIVFVLFCSLLARQGKTFVSSDSGRCRIDDS